MKNLLKFSFIIVIVSLLGTASLFAATPTSKQTTVTPVVLATVNIEKATIVSEKGNVFDISFSLSNREGLQTGVKYGVKLVKEDKGAQFVVDEKIYDESLTLNPNTTVSKAITYTAPTFLSGSYTLILTSQNTNGFPFAIVQIGKVTLTATTSSIQILPETCFLQVIGEKNNPKYALTQGVDIKPEENLKLTCTAKNFSKASVTVTPTYETRYRSSYGDVVPQTGGDSAPITFKAGESKTFFLTLPKSTAPQAYDLSLSLNSKDSNSNSLSIHYVIRGVSATIQSISLDKDYYKDGENALVSFVYSPSADSSGIRLGTSTQPAIAYKIDMENGNGKSCTKAQTGTIAGASPKMDLTVSVRSNCTNPKITVTLTDDKSTVLDQKEFTVKTTSTVKPNDKILYIIIVLALLLIAVVYMYMKKKNTPMGPTSTSTDGGTPMAVIFFLLIVSMFSFLGVSKASADTVAVGSNNYAVVNIDKSTYYYPTDSVYATGILYSSPSNTQSAGTILASVPSATALTDQIYYRSKDLMTSSTKTGTFTIPSANGTYNTAFSLSAYLNTTTTTVPAVYTPCWHPSVNDCTRTPVSVYYQRNADNSYTTYITGGVDGTKFVKTSEASAYNTDNYTEAQYNLPFSVLQAPVATPMTVRVYATKTTIGDTEETTPYWTTTGPAVSCRCSYVNNSGQNIDCTPQGSTVSTGPDSFVYGKIAVQAIDIKPQAIFNVVCKDGTSAPSTPTYYPTCFIADTLVTLADGKKVNIQDVRVGDVLKGEKTNNKVLGLHRPELNGKLYSFNDGRYFVTEEHPFKTIDGWKSINPKKTEQENIGITVTELKVGDTLVTEKGLIKIKTIDWKVAKESTDLFNFILDGDHTYYADGYLVHNKAQCDTNSGLYCGGSIGCIGADGLRTTGLGQCGVPCTGSCGAGYTASCDGGTTVCYPN